MYKINDFSKITGLPASTLRYYDREGILTPTSRDQTTSYRYYSEEDYEKANMLSILRNNHFSIAEIKDILMTISNVSDLPYYLAEKKQRILLEIEALKTQINTLESFSLIPPIGKSQQDYVTSFVTIKSQPYIYREFSGDYSDMSHEVNFLYTEAKNSVCGPLFLIEKSIDGHHPYRIGVPVKHSILSLQVKNDTLELQTGVQITHTGSYHEIGPAYKYLIDYADRTQICENKRFIVRFIRGSGKVFKGNEHSYITEIILLTENRKE